MTHRRVLPQRGRGEALPEAGREPDALGVSRDQLASRAEHAGFGALLRQDICDHYRAAARGTAP
ncbi:hypothetical protein SSPO_070380 [Streptomyces antimycoticus]|uniref:Uncharacterized protein n=1 Tax=Streptomyces antimycoticus TaxID=68175 RepID=A0A499UUK7_9ACTN|nr:hypothetical protein SSPO_070380 [Streptomyces antimycoticus]